MAERFGFKVPFASRLAWRGWGDRSTHCLEKPRIQWLPYSLIDWPISIPHRREDRSVFAQGQPNKQRLVTHATAISHSEPLAKLDNHRELPPPIQEKLGADTVLDLVPVPSGTLSVTPELPMAAEAVDDVSQAYEVKLSAFCLGKYPVTQKQWYAVSLLPPVNRELRAYPAQFRGDDLPIERVNWYEVQEFCDRLSRFSGHQYRLPSEAEWEYACRAGTQSPYCFGEALCPSQANFGYRRRVVKPGFLGIGRETVVVGTEKVGSYPANTFGLHDMHGNVWEWCQDVWRYQYHPMPLDGTAWTASENQEGRVCRGGAWAFSDRHCRSDYRDFFSPSNRLNYLGFRVACDEI